MISNSANNHFTKECASNPNSDNKNNHLKTDSESIDLENFIFQYISTNKNKIAFCLKHQFECCEKLTFKDEPILLFVEKTFAYAYTVDKTGGSNHCLGSFNLPRELCFN